MLDPMHFMSDFRGATRAVVQGVVSELAAYAVRHLERMVRTDQEPGIRAV